MTNPVRGEASFKAGSQTYTIVFNVNVFCELEEDTGMGINDLLVEVQGRPSFKMLRAIFRAGLSSKHPNITLEEAGDAISDAGVDEAAEALRLAIERAMPVKKAGPENPPPESQKDGTG